MTEKEKLAIIVGIQAITNTKDYNSTTKQEMTYFEAVEALIDMIAEGE